MTPKYNKVHNKFKYNGHHFTHEELKEVAYSLVKEGESFEKEAGNFLIDWLNENDYLIVNTSGSTGRPKSIKLKKQAMVNSAIATGNYFNLKPGDKALHCLPSQFIAGKMMFVRAMVLGLEIDCVAPRTHPIFNFKKRYDFSAMIPSQINNAIDKLENIKTIIIGGSKITQPILDKISSSSTQFFETYGMTETVTHVAVRQLKSKGYKRDDFFLALDHISFQVDNRDCLIINASNLLVNNLVTNDIVSLNSKTSFNLLGRYDNVINSGGVKLFPEQIEEKIQPSIKDRFIVASEKDATFGEILILIIENPRLSKAEISNTISGIKTLTKFEIPKKIYTIQHFIETDTGKINRAKTLKAVID